MLDNVLYARAYTSETIIAIGMIARVFSSQAFSLSLSILIVLSLLTLLSLLTAQHTLYHKTPL